LRNLNDSGFLKISPGVYPDKSGEMTKSAVVQTRSRHSSQTGDEPAPYRIHDLRRPFTELHSPLPIGVIDSFRTFIYSETKGRKTVFSNRERRRADTGTALKAGGDEREGED
jgi:hypothetical protein